MELVSDVLLVAGSAWCVVAAAGVLRFNDVYSRLHTATKATTLGLALVIAGAALRLDPSTAPKIVLTILLVFLTAPVGAHLIGRAVYQRPASTRIRLDAADELSDAHRRRIGQPPPGNEH